MTTHQIAEYQHLAFLVLGYIGLLLTLYVGNAVYRLWMSRDGRYPDLRDQRVSLHETGHLITAWSSARVHSVYDATIVPDFWKMTSGTVHYAWNGDCSRASTLWPDLVISLGGITAEMMMFRAGTHWMNADKDLENVREVSSQLADRGSITPPWASLPGYNATIIRYAASGKWVFFKHKLTPDQEAIINQGFLMAQLLINSHGENFHRMVDLLVDKRTLLQTDMETVLGNRTMIKLAGRFDSVQPFILPQHMSSDVRNCMVP